MKFCIANNHFVDKLIKITDKFSFYTQIFLYTALLERLEDLIFNFSFVKG